MNDALDADRLRRRREHLMSEITLDRAPAPAPAPVRRAPRRALALASAVVLTAGAFVALSARGGGGTAGTAFATERAADGTVSVRVVDSDVSAKAMTKQLRAAGVDVRVETMAASPQLVGTWLYVSADEHIPDAVAKAVAAQTRGYVATLEIPGDLPGGMVLGVGRAPHRGETVAVSGRRNALAPGGLLYCTRLSGAPVAAAATKLAGWTVRWAGGTPAQGARVTLAYVADDAPKTVELTALPPTDPRYAPQSWLGYAPSARERDDRGWSTGC